MPKDAVKRTPFRRPAKERSADRDARDRSRERRRGSDDDDDEDRVFQTSAEGTRLPPPRPKRAVATAVCMNLENAEDSDKNTWVDNPTAMDSPTQDVDADAIASFTATAEDAATPDDAGTTVDEITPVPAGSDKVLTEVDAVTDGAPVRDSTATAAVAMDAVVVERHMIHSPTRASSDDEPKAKSAVVASQDSMDVEELLQDCRNPTVEQPDSQGSNDAHQGSQKTFAGVSACDVENHGKIAPDAFDIAKAANEKRDR